MDLPLRKLEWPAIEPSGGGFGRRFLQHFLPPHSVASNSTLQAAITAYYQERWWRDGQKLLDESQLALWKAKETNDQEKMAAALELEKQARALSPTRARERPCQLPAKKRSAKPIPPAWR